MKELKKIYPENWVEAPKPDDRSAIVEAKKPEVFAMFVELKRQCREDQALDFSEVIRKVSEKCGITGDEAEILLKEWDQEDDWEKYEAIILDRFDSQTKDVPEGSIDVPQLIESIAKQVEVASIDVEETLVEKRTEELSKVEKIIEVEPIKEEFIK